MKRVAVFGAGITGLAAAWKLEALGAEVAVFDPARHPGGVVQSLARDGYLVELGPNTVLEKDGALAEWIDGLGLRGRVLHPGPGAKKRFILHQGRPVAAPMSPWAFAASPLLSVGGKLRLLSEPFCRAGTAGDESVAAFFHRRLGAEAVERLIDPFVSGIYAGDPMRLSARHCFPKLWQWEREAGSLVRGMLGARRSGDPKAKLQMISFPGGLSELPRAAAERLGVRLHLGSAPTVRQQHGGWNVQGYGYFDAIVAAMPPGALADWLEAGLPGVRVQSIRQCPCAALRIWHFGVERAKVGHALDGFGVLAPGLENEPVLGVLFSSTLFAGRAPEGRVLLTVFQGGVRHPKWCAAEASEQARAAAWDAVHRWLTVEGEPEWTHETLWKKAIPQYEVGHGRLVDELAGLEAAFPGLYLRGNLRGGVAVGDCVASGFAVAGEAMAG